MGGQARRVRNRDDWTIARAKTRSSRDAELDDYIRDVWRYPLLTTEKEREVCRALNCGTEEERAAARDVLICANLRLVISEAKGFARHYALPMIELIQEGNIGLMKAVKRFDYLRGYKFSTYATWWIRQAMRRAALENGRTIRFPANVELLVRAIFSAQLSFVGEHGRMPTVPELYRMLSKKIASWRSEGMTLENFKYYVQLADTFRSWRLGGLEGVDMGDGVVDRAFIAHLPTPYESAVAGDHSSVTRCVMQALAELRWRERSVLMYCFGFTEDGRRFTLAEVGALFTLSRERIRQIQKKALKKLACNQRLRELNAELA